MEVRVYMVYGWLSSVAMVRSADGAVLGALRHDNVGNLAHSATDVFVSILTRAIW